MEVEDENNTCIDNPCKSSSTGPEEPREMSSEPPELTSRDKSTDGPSTCTTQSKKFTDDIDWWPDENTVTTKIVNYIDLDEGEGADEITAGGDLSSGTEDTDPSSCSDREDRDPRVPRVSRKKSSDSSVAEVVIVEPESTTGHCDEEVQIVEPRQERGQVIDSSSSLSSSEDEELAGPFNRVINKGFDAKLPLPRTRPPRTRGEILLKDLPEIEMLSLKVGEVTELRNLGTVTSIVDHLVVIQSCVGVPSLDSETVLFKEDRSSLGQVFDIFGPVSSPYYSVRFNSEQHAIDSGVEVGMKVFYAPSDEQLSKYIFLEQLRQEKGSDASWKHDNEPPVRFLDYSDDETEKRERRKIRSGQPVSNTNDTTPEVPAPKSRKKAASKRSHSKSTGHMNSQPYEQSQPNTSIHSNGQIQNCQPQITVGDWRSEPPPSLVGNWPRLPLPNPGWSASYHPPSMNSGRNSHFNPQQMQVPAFDPTIPPPNYYAGYSNLETSYPVPACLNETRQPQAHPQNDALQSTSVNHETVSHAPPDITAQSTSRMNPPETLDSHDLSQSDNPQYKNLYDYYMNYYTNYYESHMQSSSKQGNE